MWYNKYYILNDGRYLVKIPNMKTMNFFKFATNR